MTELDALATLRRKCAPDQEPTLDAAELLACLTEARRYTTHITGVAVAVGDRVVSASPNGRVYRCIVAGTTAGSAPAWPTTSGGYIGQRISDGTAVVWEDAGPAPSSAWDMAAAVRAAWQIKAAKDAAIIDYASGSDRVTITQRRDFALRMAGRNPSVFVV